MVDFWCPPKDSRRFTEFVDFPLESRLFTEFVDFGVL